MRTAVKQSEGTIQDAEQHAGARQMDYTDARRDEYGEERRETRDSEVRSGVNRQQTAARGEDQQETQTLATKAGK